MSWDIRVKSPPYSISTCVRDDDYLRMVTIQVHSIDDYFETIYDTMGDTWSLISYTDLIYTDVDLVTQPGFTEELEKVLNGHTSLYRVALKSKNEHAMLCKVTPNEKLGDRLSLAKI